MLAIDIPLFAKLNGAQIAVAFFEVGAKIVYAEFSSNARAYLVDKGCVFVRTDGEGGGKKVKSVAMRLKIPRGVFKAQGETKSASRAAFGVGFVPFDEGYIFVFVLLGNDEFYAVEMRNDFFKRVFAFDKLVFWQNVGIVIVYGHVKMRREIFKHTARARSATGVQKQTRLLRARF